MTKRALSLLLFSMAFYTLPVFSSQNNLSKKDAQLNKDLNKVWPFIQTVKIEYDLALAQLETIDTDSMKKKFLDSYENYVEDTYYKDLIRLNIRQGRLLLLLIDRELGKTPYDLLEQFRNKDRADFWEKIAIFIGADLKSKYDPEVYPEIEAIVLQLSKENINEFLPSGKVK